MSATSFVRTALATLLFASILTFAGCAEAPGDSAVQAETPGMSLSGGSLTIEPAACDFGTVQQTDVRSVTLTATNTGTEPVRLLALGGT